MPLKTEAEVLEKLAWLKNQRANFADEEQLRLLDVDIAFMKAFTVPLSHGLTEQSLRTRLEYFERLLAPLSMQSWERKVVSWTIARVRWLLCEGPDIVMVPTPNLTAPNSRSAQDEPNPNP